MSLLKLDEKLASALTAAEGSDDRKARLDAAHNFVLERPLADWTGKPPDTLSDKLADLTLLELWTVFQHIRPAKRAAILRHLNPGDFQNRLVAWLNDTETAHPDSHDSPEFLEWVVTAYLATPRPADPRVETKAHAIVHVFREFAEQSAEVGLCPYRFWLTEMARTWDGIAAALTKQEVRGEKVLPRAALLLDQLANPARTECPNRLLDQTVGEHPYSWLAREPRDPQLLTRMDFAYAQYLSRDAERARLFDIDVRAPTEGLPRTVAADVLKRQRARRERLEPFWDRWFAGRAWLRRRSVAAWAWLRSRLGYPDDIRQLRTSPTTEFGDPHFHMLNVAVIGHPEHGKTTLISNLWNAMVAPNTYQEPSLGKAFQPLLQSPKIRVTIQTEPARTVIPSLSVWGTTPGTHTFLVQCLDPPGEFFRKDANYVERYLHRLLRSVDVVVVVWSLDPNDANKGLDATGRDYVRFLELVRAHLNRYPSYLQPSFVLCLTKGQARNPATPEQWRKGDRVIDNAHVAENGLDLLDFLRLPRINTADTVRQAVSQDNLWIQAGADPEDPLLTPATRRQLKDLIENNFGREVGAPSLLFGVSGELIVALTGKCGEVKARAPATNRQEGVIREHPLPLVRVHNTLLALMRRAVVDRARFVQRRLLWWES